MVRSDGGPDRHRAEPGERQFYPRRPRACPRSGREKPGTRYHRVPVRTVTMLDDRKAAILRAVVREYIETAQPVGSTRVARQSSLRVSPATVRNEMATLEREGYLVQPHTSAGRVPTDKGYRFFVDQLTAPG